MKKKSCREVYDCQGNFGRTSKIRILKINGHSGLQKYTCLLKGEKYAFWEDNPCTDILSSLFTEVLRVPDKRGIEDNSKIIFLISQRKHML